MGTDFAASVSGSSSASAGLQQDFRGVFGGDFIVGGKKPTPPWLWIALAAFALVAATVYFVRR